jgi:uncharacterized lipoprotein YmbA
MSEVKFTVPDFVDPETGIEYSEIEVVVVSEGDVRDASRLADSLTATASADVSRRASTSRRSQLKKPAKQDPTS